MKKNLIVIQDGCMECGVACLLSIIRYYGGDYPINRLLELTKTNRYGTSFYDISMAALEIGLHSKSYKINDLDKFDCLKTPILCQLNINNYNHFCVVYEKSKDTYIIMDPAYGKVKMSRCEFNSVWTGYAMIFNPYKILPIVRDDNHFSKLFIDIIFKNKIIVINILLLSIIFTIISCLYTSYMKIVIDYILDINYSNLEKITLVFIIILIIKNIIDYIKNNLIIKLSNKLDYSLMLNTFNRLLLLPYNYYKNKTTGDIISRINDLVYVKNILIKIITSIFLNVIISLVSAVILFKINRMMFMLLLIIILIYLIIIYIFRPLFIKYIKYNQEYNSLVNSRLVEIINGFETIKGLNIESIEYKNISNLYNNLLKNNVKLDKVYNIEQIIKNFIECLIIIIINYIGFRLILLDRFTIGSLLLFNSLLVYFISPIRDMLDLIKECLFVKSALRRINNIFEVEEDYFIEDNYKSSKFDIRIDNLSFMYGNRCILNNLNIYINEQDRVLLIGRSGSGKSTLLKILYKYYNIENNMVYINNIDINNLSKTIIRKHIAYVSCDEILFNDTIKNNILLGRNISEEEFNKICLITHTDDIVKNKLLGYDTRLEENGQNISGGERKRIILARTLVKNADIYLMDEILNELDVKLEREILLNMFSYYKDKIFVIVSHRLKNLDLYNQIIKLSDNEKR